MEKVIVYAKGDVDIVLVNLPSQFAQSVLGINLLLWVLIEYRELIKQHKKPNKKDFKAVLLFALLTILFVMISILMFSQGIGYIKNLTNLYFWLGIFLINAGVVFRHYSMYVMGNLYEATLQIQTKPTLIKIGPFSIVRHPCYTGFMLSLWGIGLSLLNWVFLILIIIFSLTVFLIQIRIEEKGLENYFGLEYKEYQMQTKKLIPFIW